jgi:hypothetical protein
MAFNIGAFRSSMQLDGARSNLFEVAMNFPTVSTAGVPPTARVGSDGLGVAEQFRFFCRGAQLPGTSINPISVNYFGRELKFAGNRNFPEWTVTLMNDEDFKVRNALELWLNGINSHRGNLRNPAFLNPQSYTVNATVVQFAKTGEALKSYTFVGMFPIDVSPIDMDWASNDTIEEYAVTMAYQWWEQSPNDTGVTGEAPPTRNVAVV